MHPRREEPPTREVPAPAPVKRGRGRPPVLRAPRAQVTVHLSADIYDRYYRLARAKGFTMHGLLVRVLSDVISATNKKTPDAQTAQS